LVHIGLGEAYIAQTGLLHASPGPRDRPWVAFHSHYLSQRANQTGRQHCYVSDAGAEIQDTLAGANARFKKESLGARSETCTLPD
jgi:hypothetical protein